MTFIVPEPKSDVIYRAELLKIVQMRIDEHPRSQQTQIGPSEIGGCASKVAFKITYGGDGGDDDEGGWAAAKGTQLHSWFDDIYKGTDRLMPDGSQRFFSDLKLPPVVDFVNGGTLDLYDALYQRVVDWKFPGDWSMKQTRGGKVSPGYFVQTMVYGYGLEQTGRPVSEVGICWCPMNGDDLHGTARGAILKLWDYDRQIALDAIERVAAIKRLVDKVGFAAAFDMLEKTSDFCSGCPAFHANADRRATCQGVTGRAVKNSNDPFS